MMAKNLVQIRRQINSLYSMKAQLNSISMMLSTVHINAQMMESMQGVTKVMGRVNEQMNIQDINKMIREFAKNSEKFNLQSEIVGFIHQYTNRPFLRCKTPWKARWEPMPTMRLMTCTTRSAKNKESQ